MKMKREMNDDGPHPEKRNRRSGDDQVRILIPSNIAGAIIGKGGQHIQKMRTQYKATVSVDDSQGPERTILISADLDATLQIITDMLKYFDERDDEIDVRLLIHQSLAGCVIGKGGQKIKEIRDKIGCRILKVFSNVAPQSTDRVVQTVGKQNQVIDAIREVITLTHETPIKGAVHNYNPVNFDRMYAEEYGGYGTGGNGGGGGGNVGGNNRQSRGGRGGGGGGGGGGFGNDRGGNRNDRSRSVGRRGGDNNPFLNPWANGDGFGNGPNNGGFGGGNFGGGGGGGFGNNFGNNGGGGFGNGPNVGNFGGNNGGFGPGNQGGFGSGGGGGGGGFGGGNPMGGGPAGGFGGNQNFGNNGGMNPGNFGPNNMGNGPMGGNAGSVGGANFGGPNLNGSGGGGNNANSGNLPNGHDPKNSTQVTIPKDLAGAIIGKGGGRIRRIRNESGAYITIDEPLPGSTDRIITISGNPKQIQMAQYLLQQSVHENNGNRRNF